MNAVAIKTTPQVEQQEIIETTPHALTKSFSKHALRVPTVLVHVFLGRSKGEQDEDRRKARTIGKRKGRSDKERSETRSQKKMIGESKATREKSERMWTGREKTGNSR